MKWTDRKRSAAAWVAFALFLAMIAAVPLGVAAWLQGSAGLLGGVVAVVLAPLLLLLL